MFFSVFFLLYNGLYPCFTILNHLFVERKTTHKKHTDLLDVHNRHNLLASDN